MDESESKINEYYSSVDKNYINDLCKNNNLRNLIHLSTTTDLYLFDKKHKKWHLKSPNKLLKKCESIKKKELKNSSSILSNLAKLNNDNINVSTVCDNLKCKINNIDNMIRYIHAVEKEPENIISLNIQNSEDYIECYSNC
jgi:hypothetical protein